MIKNDGSTDEKLKRSGAWPGLDDGVPFRGIADWIKGILEKGLEFRVGRDHHGEGLVGHVLELQEVRRI